MMKERTPRQIRQLMNVIRGRRGDEIVEAALVLPILILTILSMILLILYFYLCLSTQTALHGNLAAEAAESKAVFRVCRESDAVSSEMGGLADLVMSKSITGRMYVINHAEILRAGEFVGLD